MKALPRVLATWPDERFHAVQQSAKLPRNAEVLSHHMTRLLAFAREVLPKDTLVGVTLQVWR